MKIWLKKANELLIELREVDFGYSLDENIIRPPKREDYTQLTLSNSGYSDNQMLYNFYLECDGLSWPDVHNGYFIHSVEKLNEKEQRKSNLPTKISGIYRSPILVFGSDGGGGLFAVRKQYNDILYLPNGLIQEGIFDGETANIKKIGDNFSEFLEKLLSDLEAFVFDKEGYIYIQ